jgi:DNA-binding response OmpR family regulator
MVGDAFIQRGIEFSHPSGKVLLVDEDRYDLELYSRILEGQGFKILACSSYTSGLEYLDAESFDFVLVSQGSRAFEGRIVLERAMHRDRHRAVLVVTNCIDMGCYLEAMQIGAVDYLEKPIAPSELLRFVQVHIQTSKFKEMGSVA